MKKIYNLGKVLAIFNFEHMFSHVQLEMQQNNVIIFRDFKHHNTNNNKSDFAKDWSIYFDYIRLKLYGFLS